jgi:hypothetical protein
VICPALFLTEMTTTSLLWIILLYVPCCCSSLPIYSLFLTMTMILWQEKLEEEIQLKIYRKKTFFILLHRIFIFHYFSFKHIRMVTKNILSKVIFLYLLSFSSYYRQNRRAAKNFAELHGMETLRIMKLNLSIIVRLRNSTSL